MARKAWIIYEPNGHPYLCARTRREAIRGVERYEDLWPRLYRSGWRCVAMIEKGW